MSKIQENEVINDLINDINNNSNNINNICSSVSNKNVCLAAVKYTTIGRAYIDIQNNKIVILITEEENNIKKTSAYTRCCKTTKNGEDFCHIHCNQMKRNERSLKRFDTDIVPIDCNDNTRRKATLDDDYFENMGKRGANKKNSPTDKDLLDILSDPKYKNIVKILIHKDKKKLSNLLDFATNLLDGITDNKSIKSKENKKKSDNINDLINSIKGDDYETVVSSEDNISLSSEEEANYLKIYSIDDKEFYLDTNTFEIYKSEDESDNGTCIINIGILKESSYEYHNIIYEDKLYAIVQEEIIKKRGKIYLSLINNVIFDKNMNYIGDLTKISDNEYKYDFSNEI